VSDDYLTSFEKKLNYYKFFNSHTNAFLTVGIVGSIISYVGGLTLNSGTWSTFLGLIVQIFVAFITVIIVFYIARITFILMNIQGNQQYDYLTEVKNAKNDTLQKLEDIIPIIIVSLILMPLGGLEIENDCILKIWNTFKLDWFFIFGMLGFSFSTLYKILKYLHKLLKMDFKETTKNG